MPTHELRDAFAAAAGSDVQVSALRMRYGPKNLQILEVTGFYAGVPFSVTRNVEPHEDLMDAVRKMAVELRGG